MIVSRLEVALTAQEMPFESLSYHHPAVQALAWSVLSDTATTFSPEESKIYDMPDSPPIGRNIQVMQSLFSDPTGGSHATLAQLEPRMLFLPAVYHAHSDVTQH